MRGCGIRAACGEDGVAHRAGQGAVAGVVGVALVARLRVAEERAAGRRGAWLGLGLGLGLG